MGQSNPNTRPNESSAGEGSTPPNTGQAKAEETTKNHSSVDWLRRVTDRRFPSLTDEEFATLFHIYKTSPDPAARADAEERILGSHTRFILYKAQKYIRSDVPILEMVQEGFWGARRALQKFELKRGVKFISYASWWIRRAMQRYHLNTKKVVRIPIHLQTLESAIQATVARFAAEHGRQPDETEIYRAPPPVRRKALAERFTETEVCNSWREGPLPREWSFDAPVRNVANRVATLHDIFSDPGDSPETAAIRNQDTALLRTALDTFARRPGTERSVALFRAYHLDEYGIRMEELGTRYGISRERVRKLLDTAMFQLRRIMAGLLQTRNLTRPSQKTIPSPTGHHWIFATEQQIGTPQDGVLLFDGERWLNKQAAKRFLGVPSEKILRRANRGSIRVIRYRASNVVGSPAFYAEKDLQLAQEQQARSRQRNQPTQTTDA